MQETGVQALGWEDPLQKEVATHSSILSWEILWTEEPGMLQSIGSHRVGYDWSDLAHTRARSQEVGSMVTPSLQTGAPSAERLRKTFPTSQGKTVRYAGGPDLIIASTSTIKGLLFS